MSEKTKIKVNDLLGVALKSAISRTLGATPVGIGAGVAIDVVKAVTTNNKVAQNSAAEEIKDVIVKEISKDPVLINQMNLENPVLSRTAQGGFVTVFMAALALYQLVWGVPVIEWDLNIVGPLFGVVAGGAWTLWGRLRGNLPPAFNFLTTKKE